MPRSTRRTTVAVDKEKENASTKKPRHRLSTTELAQLEDVFRQETHPSRQQKKDLAAQLGMNYKTVTIWFQNKRQTSKRGQLPVPKSDNSLGRARADSCLRTVSSPSHNATLDVVPTARIVDNSITSLAIVKIKPLLDSLNPMTSKHATEATDDVNVNSQTATVSVEQQTKPGSFKTVKWKRTLEWACKRQAKRRKLSREGYIRLGSAEHQDDDPKDTHMDSALSLLSFASSAQVGPPRDVMRGASLLLSFKYSWCRK